jgi:predicted membrane protein
MSCGRKHCHSGTFLGLILIAVGALWVLDSVNVIDFHIKNWWPLILIVFGLLDLVNARRVFNFSGWFLIVLGGIFLLATNDIVIWGEIWRYGVPAILILIGLSMISRRDFRPMIEASGEDEIGDSAVFGSAKRKINSKNFKGGSASRVFGDSKIDLREAELAGEGAVLDISSVFGDITVLVPKTWPLDIRSTKILGDFENNTENEQKSEGKRLVVRVNVIFGDIKIKN